MQDNGKTNKKMVMVNNFGRMNLSLKDYGQMIKLMVEED